MKRLLCKLEIFLIIIFLLACANERTVEDNFFDIDLNVNQISHIDIEYDIYKKTFTSDDDLDFLIGLLTEIKALDDKTEYFEDKEIFKIEIYQIGNNESKSISIVKNIAYYNDEWTNIGSDTYNNLINFYENSNSEKYKDDELVEISQGKVVRKEKSIVEALKGTWIDENETLIKFDDKYLYQGDNYRYKYIIDEVTSNTMSISFYGIEGFLIENHKLFDFDIIMDSSNTYMKIKKSIGGHIYDYKLIYVDDDGLKLGTFDTYFFIEE